MYVEGIGAKLIFDRCAGLNWGDRCEIEAALVADKDDLNEEEDTKAKASRLRNKKQRLKRTEEKEKIRQQAIEEARGEIESLCSGLLSPSASRSGPASSPPQKPPGRSVPCGLSSPISPSLSRRAFPLVVSPDSLVHSFRHPQSAPRNSAIFNSSARAFIPPKRDLRRSTSIPREDDLMEENFVSPPKIFMKRLQNEVDETNRKKL